jgi:FtsH-binding integral membrane protein
MRYEDPNVIGGLSMPYGTDRAAASESNAAGQATAFLGSVYAWMCAGLLITAATAWFVAGSPSVIGSIARSGFLFWGLVVAQFATVFVLSARVQQLDATTASLLFIFYAALTGVTLSFALLAFTGESVATTFVVTAGMFAGLAMYGTVTKRSLGGIGQFLFMGLLGLVLASIVGLFWHSNAFQFVLSFIGVLVFSGLVAYDAQRLKAMALGVPADRAGAYAAVGALMLYLDFTNLFLFLLRLTGNRRQSNG